MQSHRLCKSRQGIPILPIRLTDQPIPGRLGLALHTPKELLDRWPMHKSLGSWHFAYVLGLLQESLKRPDKGILSQQARPAYVLPRPRPVHPLLDKRAVPHLRLAPLAPQLWQEPIHGQKGWHMRLACGRPLTPPGVVSRRRDKTHTHGRQHHIAAQLQQIAVSVYHHGLVSPLQCMTCETCETVEAIERCVWTP